MNNCKVCNTSFKFCSSCKFTLNTFAKSLGYCCVRCLRVHFTQEDFVKSGEDDYEFWVLNQIKEK